MEVPFPTQNPAPPPAVPPALAAAPAVPRLERIAAGLLVGSYFFFWWVMLPRGVGLWAFIQPAIDTWLHSVTTLIAQPAMARHMIHEFELLVFYGLLFLTLPLGVGAFLRVCGWPPWWRGRAFWKWALGHAVVWIASSLAFFWFLSPEIISEADLKFIVSQITPAIFAAGIALWMIFLVGKKPRPPISSPGGAGEG